MRYQLPNQRTKPTTEPPTKNMKNEATYFENHIPHSMKLRFIALIGPSVLKQQEEMSLALARFGSQQRIADSKRACAERWERRERMEIAARMPASV